MASTIQIKRGTGSAVPSGLADGELAINLDNRRLYFGSGSTSVNDFSFGEITAEKYIVSSSVLYVTTSFSSGSTEFGDTADDTHTFTGHITASGNISASGTIIGSNLSGTNTGDQDLSSYSTITQLNASSSTLQTNIDAKSSITQLNASSSTLQTNIDAKAPIANPSFTGHITASGNISSSGDIYSSRYFANEQLALNNVNGAITLGYDNTYPINIGKSTNPIGIYGNITSSGHISASGNNYASEYYTDGYSSLNTSGTQGRVFSDANITGIQIGRNGSPDKNIELLGPVTASGDISASGKITANSIFGTVGTATQGTIDHDSLANFVANEHIDHSGVSVIAGTGLTGGGTIAANRTLNVIGGTGVTANANDIAIGQDVATTANVLFNHITASSNISASGIITAEGLLISDDATITDDLIVNGNIDLEGDLDVNGTTNLDAVDIDGNVQLTGTLIVGVDDAGHDVTLFGNTSGKRVKWDASQDQLKLYDNTKLVFGTGLFNEADFDASIFWDASDLVIDSETDIKIVADGGSVGITGHITASGNISASGTITGNSFVGTVGTATQGTIDHDSLANFVANEHIDHSGVSITAGAGLTGGGTIASTRDIAVGAGTGITVNANDIAIGQDVATTANVLFNHITASGDISASGQIEANVFHSNGAEVGLHTGGVTYLGFNNNTPVQIGKNAGSATTFTGHITASGNISSSGTIFTDTISSPSNNLIISSSTVKITSTTDGEANLILESDSDNNDENDNPFMLFTQDGGAINGYLGLIGDADKWPDGGTLTGATANGLVLGTKGPTTSTNSQLFLAAGDAIRLTILNDGKVGIGVTDPDEALEVVGDIKLSGDIQLGHASDTTLARVSAGVVSIAGTHIKTQSLTIKVFPNQFNNNGDTGRPTFIEDGTSNTLAVRGHGTTDDFFAFVEIPPLHKVTHVQVHASANTSNAVSVRSFNYQTGADNAISATTANFNENKSITNIPSTATQDLVIKCTPGANTVLVYGATVTLALI